VVVTQELLFGVMAAAEARRTPLALFTTNAWSFPDPLDQPPFGTASVPPRPKRTANATPWCAPSPASSSTLAAPRLTPPARRSAFPPLPHLLDQLNAAERVLLGVSRAWDFPTPQPPPERFRYIGPVVSDPDWTAGWSSPWSPDDPRPLVVVSFSTFFQGQTDQITRAIEALSPLNVRVVVTLGPALDPAAFAAPDHILVVQSASHDALIPEASLLITHAGTARPCAPSARRARLALPMGRDQADNASRIALRGAGLRLDPAASPELIREA
jgi:UDP:flavonoid glycosyltransferase YjiC (YdhE family)